MWCHGWWLAMICSVKSFFGLLFLIGGFWSLQFKHNNFVSLTICLGNKGIFVFVVSAIHTFGIIPFWSVAIIVCQNMILFWVLIMKQTLLTLNIIDCWPKLQPADSKMFLLKCSNILAQEVCVKLNIRSIHRQFA